MAQPVVHFEIIGAEPAKLRGYYGDLFGWEFDTSGPVVAEVSRQGEYGFTEPGQIPGGVGGGSGHEPHVVFYVGVPDVEAALQKAEKPWRNPPDGPDQSTEPRPRDRPVHRPRGQPDRPRQHRLARQPQPTPS